MTFLKSEISLSCREYLALVIQREIQEVSRQFVGSKTIFKTGAKTPKEVRMWETVLI